MYINHAINHNPISLSLFTLALWWFLVSFLFAFPECHPFGSWVGGKYLYTTTN